MFLSIPSFSYIPFAILALLWLCHRRLVPRPLPGILYNRHRQWLPFGDLNSLGIHIIRTGATFDWFGLQCLKLKSPIVQMMIPSFSTRLPVVIIADLREIKNLIVKRTHDVDRGTIVDFWFKIVVPQATVGMQSTPAFKRQRKLWNCMVHPDFLDNVAAPAFETVAHRIIDLWTLKGQVTAGSSFPAFRDLFRGTLDSTWTYLVGRDLGLTDASISYVRVQGKTKTATVPSNTFPNFFQDFLLLMTGLLWVVAGVTPNINRWVINRIPRFCTAKTRTQKMLGGFVADTRARMHAGLPITRCGLGEVVRQQDDTVSDAALVDEVLELLFTGHETVASTMAWGLKYLADHQEVQERLYNSLKHAFPNANKSGSPCGFNVSRAEIPYLDAVLAEILRLAGTAPILFHEVVEDCEIMGHHVPAGTQLVLVTQSPPGSMLHPDTFEVEKQEELNLDRKTPGKHDWNDCFEEFIPDRWIDTQGNFDPDAGLSLPFAAGRRGCFAKRIAMLEMKMLIALLVLSFRFDQLPESRSKYNSYDSLTRQPACCYVRPIPRQE